MSTTAPVFRSDPLIGSKSIASPPPLTLPPAAGGAAAGSRTLTLVADAAHRDRPPRADPLNIRDFVDWLEPESGTRSRGVAAANPPPGAGDDCRLGGLDDPVVAEKRRNRADSSLQPLGRDRSPQPGLSHREASPRVPGLRLSRSLKPRPSDNWLCLAVSRFDGPASKIEVRVNGNPAGTFDVPQRIGSQGDPEPLVVSLRPYQGKDAKIDVLLPSEASQKLDWRGIAILEDRPGLLRLFDEEADFAKRLTDGEGKAEVIVTDHYLGVASLKVTPPERGAARLLAISAAIRERPGLGRISLFAFCLEEEGRRAYRLAGWP